MAISLQVFVRIRPCLYHLTHRDNLERIRHTRLLETAAQFIEQARRNDLCSMRRKESVPVTVDGTKVYLRDQRPLHNGNIAFAPGFTFEQLIDLINDRVYFWPGKDGAPIAHGKRHFERYRGKGPALIRVPTADILDAANAARVEFCKYNSGSPRCVGGKHSPRGPETFVTAERAAFTPGSVVEVTFRGGVRLPESAMVSYELEGPWTPLF
ncbi:MAG: hypothetical protein IT366_14720 [Candidatus Hydrogenedentes bacterium]|nr:hypothetical protein [Candidatus Hydrogenedentota bacterium]